MKFKQQMSRKPQLCVNSCFDFIAVLGWRKTYFLTSVLVALVMAFGLQAKTFFK